MTEYVLERGAEARPDNGHERPAARSLPQGDPSPHGTTDDRRSSLRRHRLLSGDASLHAEGDSQLPSPSVPPIGMRHRSRWGNRGHPMGSRRRFVRGLHGRRSVACPDGTHGPGGKAVLVRSKGEHYAELATTEPRADLRKPRPRAPPWAESDLNGRPSGWVTPGFEKYAPSSSATSPSATRLEPPSLRTGEARRWSIFGAAGVPQWRRTLERGHDGPRQLDDQGLAAMTIAVATSRGWIDYDAQVAPSIGRVRPERQGPRSPFANCSATRPAWSGSMSPCTSDLRSLDYVAPAALAKQKPAWEPGTRHGYHAMTIGLYMQELIRHVDRRTTRSAVLPRGDR